MSHENVHICVRVIASTVKGYFVNRPPGSKGCTFLPSDMAGTWQQNPGGDDILEVDAGWVAKHGFEDTIIGEEEQFYDDDGEEDFSIDPDVEAEMTGEGM